MKSARRARDRSDRGDDSEGTQIEELRRKRTLLCEEFAYAGPGENQWRSRLVVELAEVEAQIAQLQTKNGAGVTTGERL